MRGVALTAGVVLSAALSPATATATTVPADVKPSLANAATDIEVISTNGCMVGLSRVSVRTDCNYGDPYGT
jgi:hypothetical protein